MAYKWLGMKVLAWEDVEEMHSKGELPGCYKLYLDGTESEIPKSYDWSELEHHHKDGGGFGRELPTVELKLPDGKKIVAPEVIDISAMGTLDELEYSLWHTIEEYMELFGIRTEDDQPDFATVKAVQDKLLDVLTDAGVNFKVLTEGQQEIEKELKKGNMEIENYIVLNCGLDVTVQNEDIDDIMVSALEGGINYWCKKAEVAGNYFGEYASDQISRGGELILHDMEENKTYTVSKEKFIEGLKKYITAGNTECIVRETDDYGIYTGKLSIEAGNIDALAADCIIQYAVFGDVIYG